LLRVAGRIEREGAGTFGKSARLANLRAQVWRKSVFPRAVCGAEIDAEDGRAAVGLDMQTCRFGHGCDFGDNTAEDEFVPVRAAGLQSAQNLAPCVRTRRSRDQEIVILDGQGVELRHAGLVQT